MESRSFLVRYRRNYVLNKINSDTFNVQRGEKKIIDNSIAPKTTSYFGAPILFWPIAYPKNRNIIIEHQLPRKFVHYRDVFVNPLT